MERCAGLDVHQDTVAACVRFPGPSGERVQEVHTFGTTTIELLAFRDWLGGPRGDARRDGVHRDLLAARGAPRGVVKPRGDERAPPPACRSRPVKLGAA